MIRTQIQLTEKQMDSVRVAAEQEHVSVAEMIRRAIDASLARPAVPQRSEIKRRAIAIAGRYASGRADISTEHDQYLDEAFGGETHRR